MILLPASICNFHAHSTSFKLAYEHTPELMKGKLHKNPESELEFKTQKHPEILKLLTGRSNDRDHKQKIPDAHLILDIDMLKT